MTPRLKQEDREQVLESNRKALLEAAAVEVARARYDGANINRISLAAGFAKGTIYNYSPSKEALMLALLDEFAQSHFERLADAVRAVDDPRHRLHNFFEAGIEQSCFRPMDTVGTANLVMTVYLGTASQVTDEGIFFLDAAQVIDFGLQALERRDEV
jgi:AcrR family transcriptional regulator